MASEIRNPQLWQDGRLKIDWVRHHMPLLNSLEEEFKASQPFKGLKVALLRPRLHICARFLLPAVQRCM